MKNVAKPALAAIAIAVAIAGCESGGTNPKDPMADRNSGGKNPQVLNNDCLDIFPGIENCSINGATLDGNAEDQIITVTGLDEESGVSGNFNDAVSWRQSFEADLGAGGTLSYSASSDGNILGRLDIASIGGGSYNVWATYTGEDAEGSAYSIHVFNNGTYVGGQSGINPGVGSLAVIIGGLPGEAIFHNVDDGYDLPGPEPDIDPNPWQPGACEWQLVGPEELTIELPNGDQYTGTHILFTEEVSPGHVVYSHFQRVDVQGNLESYTITSESSVDAE